MRKTLFALFGIMGAAMVLFAFLPGRKKADSRPSNIRPAEPCWFCFPDAN